MFDLPDFDKHEKVVFVNDQEAGLSAIIAVHSTALGPAGGGCRVWAYETPANALKDALRLSRGMSYKNALAGLKMGGGKAVILGPLDHKNRQKVFEAFGDAVEGLGGDYITAEDVGVRVSDMRATATRTQFVSGVSTECGAGGDPSPYTARGVRLAIEAVAQHSFGRPSLDGISVAVQGLGGVGGHLCKELANLGAKLVVADVKNENVERIADLYQARISTVNGILFEDVDIVSPCALGGVLTPESVKRVKAKAIVGGANNQLSIPQVGNLLNEIGIVYAPDYLVNAGGIIMIAAEYFGENVQASVNADVDKIFDRTMEVLLLAKERRMPTSFIADSMAQSILANAQRLTMRDLEFEQSVSQLYR